MNWSNDKLKIYEDDSVIVLLATDTSSPKQTVKNCKHLGVNLSLCISDSTAKPFCFKDRWQKHLTVYFVWLKLEQKFILIDAAPNNQFQYNVITKVNAKGEIEASNSDIKATQERILSVYPELTEAFNKSIFQSLKLHPQEQAFFENLDKASSILELKTLEERLDYVCMPNKSISNSEWEHLKHQDGQRIFKEFINARTSKDAEYRDVPDSIIELYSSLKNRYWNKVKHDAVVFLKGTLTPHEKLITREDPYSVLERPTPKGILYRLFSKWFMLESYEKEKRRNYVKNSILFNNIKNHLTKTVFGIEAFEAIELLICPFV